jgi:hypothetical protein
MRNNQKQRRAETLAEARTKGFNQHGLTGEMKRLGAGGVNTVFSARYGHTGDKEWVYKADERPDSEQLNAIGAVDQIADRTSMEKAPENIGGYAAERHTGRNLVDPKFAHRSVAASELDRAMGTNALAETHFASRLNKAGRLETGIVMEKVEGHSPQKSVIVEVDSDQRKRIH